MPLQDLTLNFQYRSSEHLISRDLYDRCLPETSTFMRAVGFFSSSVFAACPSAFHVFFERGGRLLLVTSQCLRASDIKAIHRAYVDRSKIVKHSQLHVLSKKPAQLSKELPTLLSWLVATGRLDLRVAIPKGIGSHIYHEKLGIFEDVSGNRVAFSGSVNESWPGLKDNFEVVDLFRSWEKTELRRVARKLKDFRQLWSGDTHGLDIYTFPEAARNSLLRKSQDYDPDSTMAHPSPNLVVSVEHLPGLEETLAIPGDIVLRRHQKKAVREWFLNEGQGILEMATGSGKTFAALAAASKLIELRDSPLFIVIVCPFLHLMSQWREEARRFGLDPVFCALQRSKWQEELALRLYNLSVGTRRLASVLVSNATFSDKSFQHLISSVSQNFLLIADEVHNLGAKEIKTLLPQNARFRLGLSATPERWFDPSGTQVLSDYFGSTLMHYTLKDALQDGILTPYRYFPVTVELTTHEIDEYIHITKRIALLASDEQDFESPSDRLKTLLIKRARITASAQNKIPALKRVLNPLVNSHHNLIYCGDGTVEEPASQGVERQINSVVRMLGNELGMTTAKYVAETPLTKRDSLRRSFADGTTQNLVAIRCLDEGVDIPEARRAFLLASSSNPRQFIQRRGRLLRKAPGKDEAEVFDFLVLPPDELMDPAANEYGMSRKLVGKELSRALEFAKLAINGPEAIRSLLEIRDRLNLLDLGVEE